MGNQDDNDREPTDAELRTTEEIFRDILDGDDESEIFRAAFMALELQNKRIALLIAAYDRIIEHGDASHFIAQLIADELTDQFANRVPSQIAEKASAIAALSGGE